MNAYERLEHHFSRVNNLDHVAAIVGWDEAAMMPVGGGEARAQATATLSVIIHELMTEPALKDWIAEAREENLDPWQQANLREISRRYEASTCMPADLVSRQKAATARSEQAWRLHRADNNWEAMKPLLEEVVLLGREEASIRSNATGLGLYDALLDTYEPGMRSAVLDQVFGELTDFLPGFLEQVLEKQASETLLEPAGDFAVARQKKLGEQVMATLGFNFNHGRLDISHHPFCGGVSDDVRITTRYDEANFVSSLMAVVHETGHALYEQGLPAAWRHQPVGQALSSGTHESQSLMMEMQACRTREFLQYLAPLAQQAFLDKTTEEPAWQAENLYRLYTRVNRSFIRVDADEVTYPLHVILRYELERLLIEGELEVADIPDAWNEKMQRYLGLSTAGNFADGCLQDVHWPAGLFGYFPTYTLGALAAAQLFQAAESDMAGLKENIGRGNFEPLVGWLRQHVHGQGRFLSLDDLLKAATGETLSAAPFKAHLQCRYLPV